MEFRTGIEPGPAISQASPTFLPGRVTGTNCATEATNSKPIRNNLYVNFLLSEIFLCLHFYETLFAERIRILSLTFGLCN